MKLTSYQKKRYDQNPAILVLLLFEGACRFVVSPIFPGCFPSASCACLSSSRLTRRSFSTRCPGSSYPTCIVSSAAESWPWFSSSLLSSFSSELGNTSGRIEIGVLTRPQPLESPESRRDIG